jgi:hypothetical protein
MAVVAAAALAILGGGMFSFFRAVPGGGDELRPSPAAKPERTTTAPAAAPDSAQHPGKAAKGGTRGTHGAETEPGRSPKEGKAPAAGEEAHASKGASPPSGATEAAPAHGGRAKEKKGKPKTPAESAAGAGQDAPEQSDAPGYLDGGRARFGPFRIKIFDPGTRSALRIDFRLEGQTDWEDQAAFERFLKSSFQSFREQVMIAVRICEDVDLTDRDLTMLKKRIAVRVNRIFGRTLLKSVEIRDFAVYESVGNSPFVRKTAADGSGK